MEYILDTKERLYLFVGSAGGLGLLPVMPGTFAALAGVFIHLLLWFFANNWYVAGLVAALLLTALANHLLTPWAVGYWKNSDPKEFVLDEVAGYLFVPILYRGSDIFGTVIWAFFLFRLFDVIKIPPARQVDRNMHGAWGILLDDLISAAYAAGAMYFLRYLSNANGFNIGL